jgi:hypothetical protein
VLLITRSDRSRKYAYREGGQGFMSSSVNSSVADP